MRNIMKERSNQNKEEYGIKQGKDPSWKYTDDNIVAWTDN
jgi:hypothetical protein